MNIGMHDPIQTVKDFSFLLQIGQTVIGFLDRALQEKGENLCLTLENILDPLLGPELSHKLVSMVISSLSKAIHYVAKAFHVLSGEDDLAEVGYRVQRASQSKDLKVEADFPGFSEYYAYLKEAIPIHKKETMEIEKHRLTYVYWGTVKTALAMEREKNIILSPMDMAAMGIAGMKGNEFLAMKKALEVVGSGTIQLADFLMGQLTFKEEQAVINAYISEMKKVDPELDEKKIHERLDDMKAAFHSESAFRRVHAQDK